MIHVANLTTNEETKIKAKDNSNYFFEKTKVTYD